jgi:hypothetical protein
VVALLPGASVRSPQHQDPYGERNQHLRGLRALGNGLHVQDPALESDSNWNGCEKRRSTAGVAGEISWVITPLEVRPECVGNASPHGGVGTRHVGLL